MCASKMERLTPLLLVGGASGIGLAMTRLFASEPGTHVCILDVDANAGSKQAASLAAEFPLSSFTFLECNVADWDAQAAAFGQTYKDHGRIDLVAANAGIVERLRLTDVLDPVPRKPDLSIVDINVSGMVYSRLSSLLVAYLVTCHNTRSARV